MLRVTTTRQGDTMEAMVKEVIWSQYQAAFSMLEQAIRQCPDEMWDTEEASNRFWHVAYHALFYTHLYLAPTEAEFLPWAKWRKDYHVMGKRSWPPFDKVEIDEPYVREDILEYLDFCRAQVTEQVPRLKLDGESGFGWLPMNKLELQMYNIRHLQQHTGELCERLWVHAQKGVDWVGMQK
jgi:hypothetical protein